MQITVYIDVLFLTNFLADLFLLQVTEKVVRTGMRLWRRVAAAVLGSVYACLAFFPQLSFLQSALLRLLTALMMLCIAFRFCAFKQFVRCTLVFLCAALLSGGACYALFFMTPLGIKTGAVLKSGIFYWHVPVYILLCAFAAVYALLYAFERLITLYAQRKALLHRLEITLDGQNVQLSALLDTGNALFDSETGLPVIIAEAAVFAKDTAALRQIPYRTVSGEAMLPVLLPESVFIDGIPTNAVLALTPARLSCENQFRALLHPACIQGGYYEHTAIAANEK